MDTTSAIDTLADDAPEAPRTWTLDTAAAHVRGFAADLSGAFVERSREVTGLVLATIAQEHVLLLGPPGTAKSALTIAFSRGLGWRTFVRLLGKTTVIEELVGPFDLSGLMETPSRFERVTAGYLPTAQVGFLDEIFKANSTVLNSLLTILNEREFDQGATRLCIPLEIAVGASNEYPQDDALGALYDRFMLRYWVGYIRDETAFERMLTTGIGAEPSCDAGAVATLRDAMATVDVSAVVPAIIAIRAALAKDHGFVISDRRWRKSLSLVKAAAALAGRTVAKATDLQVLADCLWNRHEESDTIRATVLKYGHPALTKAKGFRAEADRLIGTVVPAGRNLNELRASDLAAAGNALAQLKVVAAEARAQCNLADPDVAAEVDVIWNSSRQLRDAIVKATHKAAE